MKPPFGVLELATFAKFLELNAQSEWADWLPARLTSAAQSRQIEWVASRCLLRKLFAEVGVSVDWAELHSESHSSLATHPEWIFSISHTRDSAMVWLAPSGNQIGADVEIVTREISPVAMQRLRSQRDDVRGLSAIEIWTLKEAAFKALTPKQQGDAWVFDMVIRGNEFFSPDETVAGYWRQELDQQWVRSIAWVQK